MTRNAGSWIGLKTAPRRRNAFVIVDVFSLAVKSSLN